MSVVWRLDLAKNLSLSPAADFCHGLLAFALLLASSLPAEGAPSPDPAGKTPAGLYYEATGAGDPVVLIHGFSLDRRMWDPHVATLAERYRVVRYDLRGHGLSEAPTEPYRAHDDLLSVYRALGIEKAVLVGLSAGAEVAVDFALAYPERVSRLVLASPGLSGYQPQGSFEWMAPVVARLREGDFEAASREWVETPLMKIAGDPDADARMRGVVLDNARIWSYSPQHQQRLDPPAVGRLATLQVPTLVMVGELDLPDTQRVADVLADGIEGARKVTIPGVGHLLNLAAPERFEAEVLKFLGSDRAPE